MLSFQSETILKGSVAGSSKENSPDLIESVLRVVYSIKSAILSAFSAAWVLLLKPIQFIKSLIDGNAKAAPIAAVAKANVPAVPVAAAATAPVTSPKPAAKVDDSAARKYAETKLQEIDDAMKAQALKLALTKEPGRWPPNIVDYPPLPVQKRSVADLSDDELKGKRSDKNEIKEIF